MLNKKQRDGLCPKSQATNLEPLKYALEKVHGYGFTNNKLDNNHKLHVCRQTLAKIEKGTNPVGKEQHYMGAFVRTLNDLRLEAKYEGNAERASAITSDMRDILCVFFGIATDKEMDDREHERRRKEILKEIHC